MVRPFDLVFQPLCRANSLPAIWSQEAWKTPACVFSPLNAQALAGGLQMLVNRRVNFAIRSGGHMPVAGHNSFGP